MALHRDAFRPRAVLVGGPLVGGRAVRNLVGRIAGALGGRHGVGFDIYHTAKFLASVSPYFCNWLWGGSYVPPQELRTPGLEMAAAKIGTVGWGSYIGSTGRSRPERKRARAYSFYGKCASAKRGVQGRSPWPQRSGGPQRGSEVRADERRPSPFFCFFMVSGFC